MSVVLTLMAIAVLALCVLVWLLSHLRDVRASKSKEPPQADAPQAADEPAQASAPKVQQPAFLQPKKEQETQADKEPEREKDVNFRPQGERGMGGPVYGDVLCSDGVYLPHVWEQDMHTSFDGRWLRTGFYESETAYLVDRKSRRSWIVSADEAESLESVHWRLPRWSGETINESGIADDAHVIMSDASFEAWLGEHLASPAEPLLQVRDLWIPKDCIPAEATRPTPALPQPGQPTTVPALTLVRHWPASLRRLQKPMEPLRNPHWQLMMNDTPQPWLVDESHGMVWRADARAFALYAYSTLDDASTASLRLTVWSVERGWQQWPEPMPEDRKPWAISLSWPENKDKPDAPRAPLLSWNNELLQQRVQADTPETERLHDGTSINCTVGQVLACAGHKAEGFPVLRPVPRVAFDWLRDPAQPTQWRAQSDPVKGQRLIWTLAKPARDEVGETPAYNLQWGERHLPGVWMLEHLVIQGRWAILMPHNRAPVRGGSGSLQVWDGERLQAVDLPWPVVRLYAVPAQRGGAAMRAGVVALTASLADKDWNPATASWRWPMHSVSASHLAQPDWRPFYTRRELAPDAHGHWQLQPRWREVRQIQHPCADGDYVWRDMVRGDTLWWWGGVHENVNNDWALKLPRTDGVAITSSGVVLCGTGPCACPHPAGEGWAMLEPVQGQGDDMGQWRLHWLNPVEKEVRTLALKARMPMLHSWDAQGLHWQDMPLPAAGAKPELAPRQLIAPQAWQRSGLEPLHQGVNGLWLRKQDLSYAEDLLYQDDWPWKKM